MTDAKLELKALLINNWDPNATSLGTAPKIHTGWYDRNGDIPCVTLTAKSEGPVSSGETQYYAMHGAGKGGVQLISGAVTIDCVAGAYEDLKGAGSNGEDLNPKQLRQEMYEHVAQLILDNQQNTNLQVIAPGEAREIEDNTNTGSDGPPVVFRAQLRAQYVYERAPQ